MTMNDFQHETPDSEEYLCVCQAIEIFAERSGASPENISYLETPHKQENFSAVLKGIYVVQIAFNTCPAASDQKKFWEFLKLALDPIDTIWIHYRSLSELHDTWNAIGESARAYFSFYSSASVCVMYPAVIPSSTTIN